MKMKLNACLLLLARVSPALGFSSYGVLPKNSLSSTSLNVKSVVVVSPPGGIGEVTVVKAASLGNDVKWFVVSSDRAKASQSVQFSNDVLSEVKEAGGKVEIAGATAQAIMGEADALEAARIWCSSSGADASLVTCLDGTESVIQDPEDKENPVATWQNAIKVVAKKAAGGVSGRKLCILSADDDDQEEKDEGKDGGFLGGLLGGKDRIQIPASLSSAINADTKLRHGKLFGLPESSPNFSALLAGPQKNPSVCDEYLNRMVRIDSSLSGISTEQKSSRHAVGEAAALIVTESLQNIPSDITLTSLRGTDKFELWQEELDRVNEMLATGQGAQIFSCAFSSVPSIERLSNWIATKWAPTVMRTYDIAGIRTGARPVSAYVKEEGVVEILWQELDRDMQSATAGRMIITVTQKGMVAARGPGDPRKGYGNISRKPLPGEDVLVRRLADAASQAMEKGLAAKPAVSKVAKVVAAKKPEIKVVSSLSSAESVAAPSAPASSATGPRTSGARRSSERARGKRTRRADAPSDATTDDQPGAFE